MDEIEMLIKTSEFYDKEADRLLEKLENASSDKEAIKILAELNSLKQKISFEINQINKKIEEERGY
jgi:hypothetical protein